MYGFCSKVECLFEPVEVTDNSNKTLTYCGSCPFTVYYKFVKFYGTGIRGHFLDLNFPARLKRHSKPISY
jgi:hypothetical protein